MADSWNFPALARKIIEDVPFIKKALQALTKMDPSTINDAPTGAKRIVEVSTGKWEIQQFNGTAWVKLGKMNMDVETLDGYSASITNTKNTIPVRNESNVIQGSISGNAATADSAKTLSETLPVNKGGTGATTAANARSNLGAAPTSHASSATTYGVASATNYGHAKASSTTPLAPGEASVGNETSSFARGDHRHGLQENVSGNAGTATKWKSTRYIDGLGVDGSADRTRYATCSTAAATAAKTVNVTGFKLIAGALVCVRFTVTNTAANATLNVNGTGAKAIRYRNAAISAGYLAANRTYFFIYDGSYYQLIGDIDTQRSVASDAEVAAGTNNSKVITPLRLANSELEAFRKSWIGVPRWWRSTVLPPNNCWANGDFVEFSDWPELQEIYEDGGFEGMLMPYNADAETQAANLGKWRPDAANPTGLYLPNLGEQFFRACVQQNECGKSLAPGLPELTGRISVGKESTGVQLFENATANGVFSLEYATKQWTMEFEETANLPYALNFTASRSNKIYGQSETVMPQSINFAVIIYLGR